MCMGMPRCKAHTSRGESECKEASGADVGLWPVVAALHAAHFLGETTLVRKSDQLTSVGQYSTSTSPMA